MRTYGDKVYINFCGLNVPEDHIACESFLLIFLLYSKTNITCKYI